MLLALALLVGTPTGWQLPDQAPQVQVLRGTTTPFVAVAEVLPTERIKACNSDEVQVGSNTTCPEAGRAPGRTDVWWLKSDVFATPEPVPAVGTIGVTVTCDAACAAQPGVFVRLYGAKEGQTKNLLNAAPVAPRLKFRVEGPAGEYWCFETSTWFDHDNDPVTQAYESASLWDSKAGVPACVAFAGKSIVLVPPTTLEVVAPDAD